MPNYYSSLVGFSPGNTGICGNNHAGDYREFHGKDTLRVEDSRKKFEDAIQYLKEAPAPNKEKQKVLEEFRKVAEEEIKALEPQLPEPHSGYPEYENRAEHSDALEFLDGVWGDYLKTRKIAGREYFRAAQDYLYQNDLGDRDPKLLEAVRSRVAYLRKTKEPNLKVSDVIPPRHRRTEMELGALDPEGIRRVRRLDDAIRRKRLYPLDEPQR